MQAYYEERPWKPMAITPTGVDRFTTLGDREFFVFEARDAAGGSHALGLEKTPGGWKLDWEVFAPVAELQWDAFLAERPATPRALRVSIIRRTPALASPVSGSQVRRRS